MKQEFDKQLCEQFPLLYRDRNAPKGGSNMRYGFCIGDGWFQIVYDLSAKLEPLVQQCKNNNLDHPVAAQVKEKFGGLRFYMHGATEEMNKHIAEAEALANNTCDTCGKPGSKRSGGWINTKCDECHGARAKTS